MANTGQEAIRHDLQWTMPDDNAIVVAQTLMDGVDEGGSVKLAMVMVLVGTMMGSVGCGGDDGGDSSPFEKCRSIGTSFCGRAVECLGGTSADEQDCIDGFDTAATCGNATSVGTTFDACLDGINGNSCQELFAKDPDTGEPTPILPSACIGVIHNAVAPGMPARLRDRVASPFSRLSERLGVSGAQ